MNITGDHSPVFLSDDAGTQAGAPAAASSTSIVPDSRVCLIETENPGNPGFFVQGSSVIVGPHTILTASHVLWDSTHQSEADKVFVYPGYNNNGIPNPPGSGSPIAGDFAWHNYEVGTVGAPTISKSDSQYDFAVIDTSYTFSSWMGVVVNYAGGTVHATGYPATNNGLQTDVVGTVTEDPVYSLLDYGTLSVSPGNSGGPLWLNANGSDDVCGIVSTGYWACQLTAGDWSQIAAWQNDDSYLWNQPSPPAPGTISNVDEWILSSGYWQASAAPGSHPSGYNVAAVGDWTGDGTDGILWYNSSTGDTDEWQIASTKWAGSVDLGVHPGSYQISGVGDFNHGGIDDVLWTSASDNGVQTDIWELNASGNWMASVQPGAHPASSQVAGIGDWTGDGTDGVLWYNLGTGDVDEWQLSNGRWAASVDLGTHPGNCQIAGVGDMFGDGIDDILWTSVNGDGTVSTDIWKLGSNGQWIDSVQPGLHPAGYHVVGIGDFTGNGTSDILWQNPTTGDVDEWLIKNGQWAGSIDLGVHPGNYQIAGIGDFTGNGTSGVLWHSAS